MGLSFGIALLGGLVAGTFGSGGQAIMVALLVLGGTPQHLAQALVLAAALPPVGLPAVLTLRRVVKVQPARSVMLAIGLATGTAFGAWVANQLDVRVLALGFGALIITLGARTVRQFVTKTLRDAEPKEAPAWAGGLVGAIAGTTSGLFGISGGVVSIPLLRRIFGLPQLHAQATLAWAVLPPLALPGVLVYLSAIPDFPWMRVAVLTLGLVLGMVVGSQLAVRLPTDRLRGGFGIIQIVLGALVVARVLSSR